MTLSSESAAQSQPITVVIPAYNLQSYLQDAVESVLKQTYEHDVLVVIMDDGSTDETLAVAQSLARRHSNVAVHSQANAGRAVTRDRLLRMASTEWVAWIDADDIASPNWLEQQAAYIQQHDDCSAVGGQGYAMTASGLAIGPIVHPLEHNEIDGRHLRGEANAFFQSCVLTRRSAMLKAGGYRAQYSAAEDFDLWLRLAEFGTLTNVDAIHLLYRVHGTSANWTLNIDQRQQGHKIMNEARVRRGFEPIAEPTQVIPPAKKDDWNRRIYWMNIALRSGNPLSALSFARTAIRNHPTSFMLWLFVFVSVADATLFLGNRTSRFQPGLAPLIRELPKVSFYRLGRWLVRLRRRVCLTSPFGGPKTTEN